MKRFCLENGNRRYEILFNHYNIVQIEGLSAVGKSLFFSDFVEQKLSTEKYENCLLINYMCGDRLQELWTDKVFDVVVIDNADILLTPKLEKHIYKRVLSEPTLWIILGRNNFLCVPSITCKTPLTCFQIGEEPNERFLFKTTYDNVAIV